MSSLREGTLREIVTDAIDIHRTSEQSFCSKSLWTPHGHPSAYGGQLMGQAIHAATVYGNQTFELHVSFNIDPLPLFSFTDTQYPSSPSR